MFLSSRRQGLSLQTLRFYHSYLGHARCVIGLDVKPEEIKQFIDNLTCSNGGRHAYYRALRAFYNWLYSPKSGMGLNARANPMLLVDAPKVERRISPSLAPDQVNYLVEQADSLRDKAIISLFADSGMRLGELAGIEQGNINRESLDMVVRYTRSVKFEDSLRLYRNLEIVSWNSMKTLAEQGTAMRNPSS